MKKILFIATTLLLVFTMSAAAFAAENKEGYTLSVGINPCEINVWDFDAQVNVQVSAYVTNSAGQVVTPQNITYLMLETGATNTTGNFTLEEVGINIGTSGVCFFDVMATAVLDSGEAVTGTGTIIYYGPAPR